MGAGAGGSVLGGLPGWGGGRENFFHRGNEGGGGAWQKLFPTVENTKLAPTRRAFVKYCVSVGCVEGWPERGDGTSGGRACGSPPEGEAVGHAGLVGGVTNVKKLKQ